jgi:hypothetical protein
MSLNALVELTQQDDDGEQVESTELWTGLTEKEMQFLNHCQDIESKTRGKWGSGMLDKFAELRSRCYRPERYRERVPKAAIDAYIEIFIHCANNIDLQDSDSSEADE